MTQTDPWAAAQAQTTPSTPAAQNGGSGLAEGYSSPESQLFSGGGGAGPSIINKTHAVGTVRTGIIAQAPYDRQSTTMKGELKFWQEGGSKPVLEPVDSRTGQPNRRVMDTVLVLDTEYAMDAAEAAALGRDTPFEGGRRSFTAGGETLKLLREAIRDANKRGVRITCDEDMVGKRFTIKRVGQKPNPHGGDPIKIHEVRIDNA